MENKEITKNEKMSRLTEDIRTMLKYGITPCAGIELLKAQEIWGLEYEEVQECLRNALKQQ